LLSFIHASPTRVHTRTQRKKQDISMNLDFTVFPKIDIDHQISTIRGTYRV
jgi:hypothetical protein